MHSNPLAWQDGIPADGKGFEWSSGFIWQALHGDLMADWNAPRETELISLSVRPVSY